MKKFISGFLEGAQETPAQFFRPLSAAWGSFTQRMRGATIPHTIHG